MASIEQSIMLNDCLSGVLHQIVNSLSMTVAAADNLQQTMNGDMDAASMEAVRDQVNQATIAVQQLDAAMQSVGSGGLPQPQIPEWQSYEAPQIFISSGLERYQQEIGSVNDMMRQLTETQNTIAANSQQTSVFPPQMTADLTNMHTRIMAINQRIQEISSRPIDSVTPQELAELERLREQLNTALHLQEQLNTACDNMDVETANRTYLELSRVIDNTERNIRDNIEGQNDFNNSIQQGVSNSNDLMRSIQGIVATYVSIQSVRKVLDISDELTATTARIDMMNQSFNETAKKAGQATMETDDLVNLVYQSAQNARGSFSDMASIVAKFGNNARDAFGSQKEVVDFANLIQKQMTIAGASTDEASNAMLQLSQALGSGVLRGDELNSIFEQAPNLIQSIADYLDVPIGSIRDMASEGQLTADIVKAAIFNSADEINEQFENMPMTWNQVFTSMQNRALMAFRPVLNKVNELANNQKFQQMIDGLMNGLAKIANMLLGVIEFAGQVAAFFSDNWSVIEPIIMGIVTAIGLYKAAVIAVNTIETIGTVIKNAAAVAAVAHGTATVTETAATTGMTAAQVSFNAALLACPVTWIVVAIIAAAAAFVIFTEQIVGAIWWVGALGKNAGLWCANVGIAIWNTIKNIGKWFVNLGQSAWAVIYNIGAWFRNVFFGLVEVVKAVGENIGTAFNNAWVFVQTGFWSLVDTISQGLKDFSEFANKCLGWAGVNIDTSGFDFAKDKISELNDQYQEFKDVGAAWDKGFHTVEYKDVSEPWEDNPIDWAGDWNKGMNTFDVFQEGWGADAYNAGAEIGAGIHDFIMSGFGLFGENGQGNGENSELDKYMKTLNSGLNDIGGGIDDVADNTARAADALEITDEDLKYLRDIAERDAVNRFTTAEVTVEFGGVTTNVNSETDIDGMIDYLATNVQKAMEITAEGVHA